MSIAILGAGAIGAALARQFARNLLASDPAVNGGRRVLFLSGDEASAKAEVAALIDAIGYAPVDLGSLQDGRAAQFPGGTLPNLHLVKFD